MRLHIKYNKLYWKRKTQEAFIQSIKSSKIIAFVYEYVIKIKHMNRQNFHYIQDSDYRWEIWEEMGLRRGTLIIFNF